MSIKDLFGKTSEKNLTAQEIQSLYDEAESEGYLEEISKDNSRFLPAVDFSSASNFARYGSAEKYYVDAIKNVYQRYPYDGSRKEKLEWRNNSSQFDLYVFDNIYPKTTGYVTLNSASQQYVTVYGGPNTASSGKFADNNIFDLSTNRESNLAINPLNLGNTVEFWFKETGANSSTFPLFDLWNGVASGSANYTRFLIQKKATGFAITYCSGTAGVEAASVAYTLDTGSWHHYGFSVASASSGLDIRLYVDGELAKSIISGSAFGNIANNASSIANIGAYRTGSATYVNAAFDEFRFWKEARSPKNISRYWFTSVGGGANTDDSNTELGVYFKFNEGVISSGSVEPLDAQCLDYSGRISNGRIINYTTSVRSTGSAINSFSSDFDEPTDPILYPTNELVLDVLNTYSESGSLYDEQNNSNIYKSLPSWISEQQEETSGEDLSNLVQIVSSYFDTLHLQIQELPRVKDIKYTKDSEKATPFINKLLSSYDFKNLDIFNDTTFLEEMLSRNETDEFEKSLTDIKNTIYQNIYNNLIYIYKSKGTEKALRNLIRCFGVDDELIKINLYADNAQYNVTNKYQYVSTQKKFIDFNDPDRYEGFIFQNAISGDSDTKGYISGSSAGALNYIPVTLQAEVIFPKKTSYEFEGFSAPEFTTVSLFGAHTAKDNASDLTWGNDEFKLVVTAEKRNFTSSDVYFKLSGSLSASGFQLTSSWFNDTYENEKWNFAIRIKQDKFNNSDIVSGSSIGNYTVEFVGINSTLDNADNMFVLSASVTKANAQAALSKNKRIYAGAHFTNFNELYPIAKSDVKISSVRFWFDYLTDEELLHHSYDASSVGRKFPHWNAYLGATGSNTSMLRKSDLLALNWDFNQVTASDSSGQFIVEDASSGSVSYATRYGYGTLGSIIKYRHTAQGTNFYPNDDQTVNKEYVFSAKLQNPEIIAGSDLIEIRNTDDITITRIPRPITYFYSIEKSMSSVINDEILSWFATIDAFNNLIGEPAERYRRGYKNLEHLRQLFFDKVKNSPDYEKFVEFYKWIDSSISLMITQLIPASSNFSSNVRNVIESHLLERNKYENKLPTIENKEEIYAITTNIIGANYREIQAPYNPTGSLWLKQRAQRTDSIVSTGTASVDQARETVRQVTLSKNLNKVPRYYDIATSQSYEGKKDFIRGYGKLYNSSASLMEAPVDAINPLNISNNLINSQFQFASSSITASGQILTPAKKKGNFYRPYEYVQTSGRTDNNKSFPEIMSSLASGTSSNYVSGVVDRTLPTRPVVKTVIVERFSAPGGAEVLSRGGLEKNAEELSAYNGLNNRNLLVRKQLNKWAAESASYDNNNPSLHKINKNAGYGLNPDGTTNPQYDNQFVQHQIPRSDAQYLWITSSLISKPSASGFFSQYDNLDIFNTGSAQFLSGTLSGGAVIDYVGLNTTITTNVNTQQNLLTVDTSSLDVNKYLLNTNGPYGYPSWKQVRQDGKRIVRDSVKKNQYIVQDPVKVETFVDRTGKINRFLRKKSLTFTRYKQPAVTFNAPMEHIVEITGSDASLELVSSYENNKERFTNPDLAKVLGVKDRGEPQTHDVLKNLETGIYEPAPKVTSIKHKEVIYPSKEFIGTADVRTRPNFDDSVGNTGSVVNARMFWKDKIVNRTRENRTIDMFEFTTSSYNALTQYKFLPIFNEQIKSNPYILLAINNTSSAYRKSILAQDAYIVESASFITSSSASPESSNTSDFKFLLKEIAFYNTSSGLFTTIGDGLADVASIFESSDGVIYAGGDNTLKKWNGTSWSSLSPLTLGYYFINSIYSGSSGVYVAGNFNSSSGSYISRWNGTSWNKLSGGLGNVVYAVFSGSSGVYSGGAFNNASGSYISKWNGTSWNPLAGGLGGTVYAIYSGSTGVYAGGTFNNASGSYISKWNGTSWNSLAGGLGGTVYAIYSGSTGVYAGGAFNNASGAHISRWDGTSWNTLSSGISSDIISIASSSEGIFVGTNGYGEGINKWNGSAWSNIGQLIDFAPYVLSSSYYKTFIVGGCYSLITTPRYELSMSTIDGHLRSRNLLEEKYFQTDNVNYSLNNISIINTEESNFYDINNSFGGIGFTLKTSSPIEYIYGVISSSTGGTNYSSGIYIVGDYSSSLYGKNISRWDGNSWNTMSGGINSSLYTIAVDNDYIYVGGTFNDASGSYISKWNQATGWNSMGDPGLSVRSILCVPSSSALSGVYVVGDFYELKKYNSSTNSWDNIGASAYPYNTSYSNILFSSDALYVARATDYGASIEKWDGTSWTEIGSPFTDFPNEQVFALASGSQGIYAGGGSIRLYKNGSWNAIGYPIAGYVNAIAINAQGVYFGGYFPTLYDTWTGKLIECNNIIKYNGTSFEVVGRPGKRSGLISESTVYASINTLFNIENSQNQILAAGIFNKTRSGPFIKDKKYNFYIEAYVPQNDLVVPSPQLIFNNFIPPSQGNISGSLKVYENIYNSSNLLSSSTVYSSNELIYTLNDGYVYEVDKRSGYKPFFNSHEEFLSSIKASSQKFGTLPEYRISDYMKMYIQQANGDFNKIITTDYLKTEGAIQPSQFQDINNSTNTTQQINCDIVFDKTNKNDQLSLNLKISGYKKLLPYKGFYPSERVVTLANYFINSFLKTNQNLQSFTNSAITYSSSLSNGTPINQQILTLLQPLFAPGILLNTIKSSIAVDFPAFITNSVGFSSVEPPIFYGHTASNFITEAIYDNKYNGYYYTASNYINIDPNFTFPFESLLEFDTIIPETLKIEANNLYYLNPTYYTSDTITGSDYSRIAYPSYNMGESGSLKPFTFLNNNYKLAMHNFLAEIPNFFLKGKLTNIVSQPENKFKVAKAGKRYYMDVVLEKSSQYKEFITDPFYDALKADKSKQSVGTYMLPSTDSLYGPPVRFWNNISASSLFAKGPYNLYSRLLDTPAYAPYVPPYYYGKAIARLSFFADETRQYTLSEIQDNIQIEYMNPQADALFLERSNYLLNNFYPSGSTSYVDNYSSSPSYKKMMALSSSINLLLKSEVRQRIFDASDSRLTNVQDSANNVFSWAIQTKFETPSINFINADLSENVGLKFVGGEKSSNSIKGFFSNMYKGMWTTYGTPIADGEGIKMYVQESFNYPRLNTSNSASLLDLCGFRKDEKKTIGLLANEKTVSEGVVVIPYTFEKNHGDTTNRLYADTLPELLGENGLTEISARGNGPYYFKLDRNILKDVIGLSFAKSSKVTFDEIKAVVNSSKVDQNNSLVKLVREMTNYVIPPHLDWLRNKNIDPFVMYIIPFETKLDQEDLSNIWQGVMPKPSLTAELETHTISHPFGETEMFHGGRLPNDIRYKIFKVKQKAHVNYYELTDDSKDDTRFKFKFGNSQEASIPEYSYNYPYDFFSLVELVNIESELTYASGSAK